MLHKIFALIGLLLATPGTAQQFTPIAVGPHIYAGGWEYFVGGGLAAFDCDGDHLPELYAAGGENRATLFRNTSTRGKAVSFAARTPDSLALTDVIGAYPLDIDSDGILDLAVLRVGKNLLLKGGADCAFTPFSTLNFQSPDRWTTAFSATWEPGQTLPTLVFGTYVDRTNPDGPFQTCDVHDLYRPKGKTYARPTPLAPGYCALSMLFSDWSRTGRADLRISNDRHYYVRGGQEQMWAFTDKPRLYAAADGWIKHELWGMGIASRDLTGDGFPDVYLTSMGDQRFQVYQGTGQPTYRDQAYDFGITAHRPYTGDDGRPSTGWHAVFGDVQNDGLDDLFVSKGNVEQMPGSAFHDPNNLLIQGPAGTFTEHGNTAGVASMARSRGAVLTDFDLDGRLDLAVVNRRAIIEVYRNTTQTTGHWIGVRPHQTGANPDAIGAWIEAQIGGKTIAREITVGGGHAGGTLTAEHFGLGQHARAKLRVIWPGGETSDWLTVKADKYLTLVRSAAKLIPAPY